MGVIEDMADALAADTMKAQEKLGDQYLYEAVAKDIGAASTTLEEAYLTAMRVRLAERRGRKFLENLVRKKIAERKAQEGGTGGA